MIKSNVYEKLKTDQDASPNYNYEILSSVIIESKANRPPKKSQRLIDTNIRKKNGCHLYYLNQLYIKINL